MKYSLDGRKDECALCMRRKYPVYEQLSGMLVCDREDCQDIRNKKLTKLFNDSLKARSAGI